MRGFATLPRLGLALLAMACVTRANAGLPLVTDDAALVDDGTCQVEVFGRWAHGAREVRAMPACNPWGFAELTLGGGRVRDDDGAWHTEIQAQVKTLLLRRRDEHDPWALGLVAGAIRATDDPEIRHGFQTLYAAVPLSLFMGEDDRLRVHLEAGAARSRPASGFFIWGTAVEFDVREAVTLLAEAYHDERGRPKFNAGVRYAVVPDRLELYAAASHRFGSDAQGWLATVGIRAQSPRWFGGP